MTTLASRPEVITMVPGCQPSTDKTAFTTQHATFTDKVRVFQGQFQKIGGYKQINFDYGATIAGTARRIYSAFLSYQSNMTTVIGTNTNLYSVTGTRLTNITPLNLTTTAIANSLSTDYSTLAANPVSTTLNSTVIQINDANASQYQGGDVVLLSGFTAVNGITAIELNAQQLVQSVGSGFFTINVGVAATATGSGGGAACVVSSGLVTVAATAHGQTNGQRTKISNATAFGGITLANINGEFIVRNAQTNTFQIMTSSFATSSVTAAGGSLTTYQTQIPAGNQNENAAQGYGAGYYGVGLYGTGLISQNGRTTPRIWYIDRYEATMMMTPGNQSYLYTWNGNTNVAPVPLGTTFTGTVTAGSPIITGVSNTNFLAVGYPIYGQYIPNNATISAISGTSVTMSANTTLGSSTASITANVITSPTAINYVFCSNDIVITFGYQGIGNQIFASDINNPQNWVASINNQVFQDTVSGAGQFVSAVSVSGTNLLFTNNRTYVFTYIGLPLVWSISLLDNRIGIIAPLACCTANGIAYWMGQNNFYRWRGLNVEIIPSNSQMVSTILNYVYTNLTSSQRSKIFAWYNERFGEIWFHYPSAQSNEPDMVARVNINENFVWTPDTFERTAAETPDILGITPRLTDWNSILYNHETGTDANGSPMTFSLVSNLRNWNANSTIVSTIVPDSIQTGTIDCIISAYEYPQSPVPTNEATVVIGNNLPLTQPNVGGRYWQYEWTGSALGQNWIMGKWQEYLQPTGAKA